ncbi:MAG: TolC family protein [Terriglobales bacterium]
MLWPRLPIAAGRALFAAFAGCAICVAQGSSTGSAPGAHALPVEHANLAASPDEHAVWTLPQVLAVVLRRHPLIAAARQQIAVAQGLAEQAGALPSLTLSYERSKVTDRGGLGELIEFPGKRGLRRAAAAEAVAEARLHLRQVQLAVAFQAEQAFARVLLTNAQRQAAEETRAAVQKMATAAQSRFRAGDVAHLQVLQARIEVERAAQAVREAVGQQRVAVVGLNVLLGLSPDARLQAEGTLDEPEPPQPGFDELLRRARRQQPQIQQAEAIVKRREKEVALARLQKFPDLNLGVSYGTEERERTAGVQASIALPWASRYRGQTEAAIGQKLAALAEVESVTDNVTENLASAYQEWLTADAQVQAFHSDLLPQSSVVVQAAQESYEQGESGLLSLLDAERTDLQVQQQYQAALYARAVAAAQLRLAEGEMP